MSWLHWFSRKPRSVQLPVTAAASGTAPLDGDPEARLRDARMDRRERLYGVVRASLVDAGVLTASYKFKVLALDDHGQQFLVMVDLAPPWGETTVWRFRLEQQIIHAAQAQHGLVITSVYWRNNPDLAAAVLGTPAVLSSPDAAPSQSGALAAGRYEPLQADEVAAFQQALAAASRTPSVPGKIHERKER